MKAAQRTNPITNDGRKNSDHSADSQDILEGEFAEAIKDGDVATVEKMLAETPELARPSSFYPLLMAYGSKNLCSDLLSAIASYSPDFEVFHPKTGVNALISLAIQRADLVVDLVYLYDIDLEDRGFDEAAREVKLKEWINARSPKDGKTAMHHLADRAVPKKVLELMQEKGADINSKDNLGNTPLHTFAERLQFAAKSGTGHNISEISLDKEINEIFKPMIDLGANPLLTNKAGRTAIHYFSKEDQKIVKDYYQHVQDVKKIKALPEHVREKVLEEGKKANLSTSGTTFVEKEKARREVPQVSTKWCGGLFG